MVDERRLGREMKSSVVETYTGHGRSGARGSLDGRRAAVSGGVADLRSHRVSPMRGISFEGSASSSEDYGGLWRQKHGPTDTEVSSPSTNRQDSIGTDRTDQKQQYETSIEKNVFGSNDTQRLG